jgi:hypothetical protein
LQMYRKYPTYWLPFSHMRKLGGQVQDPGAATKIGSMIIT